MDKSFTAFYYQFPRTGGFAARSAGYSGCMYTLIHQLRGACIRLRFRRIADLDVVVDTAVDLQRGAGQLRQLDFDAVETCSRQCMSVGSNGTWFVIFLPDGIPNILELYSRYRQKAVAKQ